ncbi:MAG TPA: hypothetical protein VL137_03775 [Polyangiaceae bacterium]|jgi:uncharacterized membrane protein|nr:hypothetical protein [Polyangiaceae bacterium]
MFQILFVLHFIGLALGVGTGFAMLTLGKSTADMPMEARTQFMLRAMVLSKNGSIGLLLLVVSGLGMMAVKGFGAVLAWGGPLFHAKLTLVVVMMGLLGYMQVLGKKVKAAGGGPLMAKLPKVGGAMLLLGITVVTLAVFAFG